jgi:hypothetical protein
VVDGFVRPALSVAAAQKLAMNRQSGNQNNLQQEEKNPSRLKQAIESEATLPVGQSMHQQLQAQETWTLHNDYQNGNGSFEWMSSMADLPLYANSSLSVSSVASSSSSSSSSSSFSGSVCGNPSETASETSSADANASGSQAVGANSDSNEIEVLLVDRAAWSDTAAQTKYVWVCFIACLLFGVGIMWQICE